MAETTTPTLGVRVNNQHEYITLTLTETTATGKNKLTLTYSYRGDRLSASSSEPVIPATLSQVAKEAGRKWNLARTNLPKGKTLGALVTEFETKAKTCNTLAEFVAKM